MKPRIFIDGEHGTTGLQIRSRMEGRNDVELLSIPEAERRNETMREDLLNSADIAILCLPDDAAAQWLASARRDGDAWTTILAAAGRLYTSGIEIDWKFIEKHKA